LVASRRLDRQSRGNPRGRPRFEDRKENGHERIPSEYIVKIGFWLRAYDGFRVEADNDAEAIKKAKTAMESGAYSEDIDIEERRRHRLHRPFHAGRLRRRDRGRRV
jgi:hypothetical protein